MNIRGLLAAVFLLGWQVVAGAVEISIGTGSQAGVYYQAGRIICRMINNSTEQHGVTCKAHLSNGSVSNLNDVAAADSIWAWSSQIRNTMRAWFQIIQ